MNKGTNNRAEKTPNDARKRGKSRDNFWSVFLWLNSLHSEVISCQSCIVVLQDDVGVVCGRGDDLMNGEVGESEDIIKHAHFLAIQKSVEITGMLLVSRADDQVL